MKRQRRQQSESSYALRSHHLRLLASLSFFFFTLGSTVADRIDDYVKHHLKREHIPGLTFAVSKDGKMVRASAYGFANLELGVRATQDTVYEIGSITKQFTATAIMMLMERGVVGLDDTLPKYVDGIPTAWTNVTVRHLLTHTSGIKSYTGVTNFVTLARNDHKATDIIKMVSNFPLEFQPGEKWNYNNTGYYLLGMIVEKASGKSYWDFLREQVFQPLGMTTTRNSDPQFVIPNRARGYSWVSNSFQNLDPITASSGWAAGSLVSTVDDLVKWDAALYTERLLRKSTLDQMWTSAKLNNGTNTDYGFGWSVGKREGHREVGHGGGTAGFSTYIARFIDDKLTVIVLTDSSGGTAANIARGIAGFYLPALREKHISDNDPEITDKLKGILIATIEGKLDPESFTAERRARLFPERARQLQLDLKDLGPLKSFQLLNSKAGSDIRTRRYRATFQKETLIFRVDLNPEGKISTYSVGYE